MLTLIAILAVLGFALSLYGFMIEEKIKRNSTYKPACDISENISCSKPILSPWGSMFGFSNAIDFAVPEGIEITQDDKNKNILIIKGIDKQKVGQVASDIRAYRPPEPYKGKGVR